MITSFVIFGDILIESTSKWIKWLEISTKI